MSPTTVHFSTYFTQTSGEGSLEKNCCWWVMFGQTEQKSSSASSVKRLFINIVHFALDVSKSHDQVFEMSVNNYSSFLGNQTR